MSPEALVELQRGLEILLVAFAEKEAIPPGLFAQMLRVEAEDWALTDVACDDAEMARMEAEEREGERINAG
jgi:hypothetical protein